MTSTVDRVETAAAMPTSNVAAREIQVVHVTSSRFFGGPERQMLELARELKPTVRSSFISFPEGQLCQPFIDRVSEAGFFGIALQADTPNLVGAARELRQRVQQLRADVLIVHGYKAGLLGLWTARRLGIPVIAVSRGWTAESRRVRLYEWLDRRALRWMDRVVCVSEGQAQKVRQAGVPADKTVVIRNAIRADRFAGDRGIAPRRELEELFPSPPDIIVGAAGRLSPEKGFDVLINAFHRLVASNSEANCGLVIFGEGRMRRSLEDQISANGLTGRVVLAGFTAQLDRWMPCVDIFVQSSHTEGLSNVLLEAAAAGVPVVATSVGGTPEIVKAEETGLLVPKDNVDAMADGIARLVTHHDLRLAMGLNARIGVSLRFSFAAHADEYSQLLTSVLCAQSPGCRATTTQHAS